MDSDNSDQAKPHASYKDMVTGFSEEHFQEEILSFDNDDIDLLEDDISVGESEGIPFIVFSERVQALALKSMDYTLVVKFFCRRVGYSLLHNRIYSIWKPSYPLKLIDIENDYFHVKFSVRSNYIKVLSDGPWMIFGHYFMVEPWSMDFNPLQAKTSIIMHGSAYLAFPSPGSVFYVDNSRFNPIFLKPNDADDLVNPTETPQVPPSREVLSETFAFSP
ncbi:hypothetical protein V6N12_050987 [Hibiscus sabdariffa]|uniref:DUF4283 domain-containing protein n=1 Tax=Hibiscus sabdariffa TaxID=183260 RepID=A0ABR2GED6_9ROSI